MRVAAPILVEVSPGDLLDRIAILRIKSERMYDPEKLLNVRRELSALEGSPRPRSHTAAACERTPRNCGG